MEIFGDPTKRTHLQHLAKLSWAVSRDPIEERERLDSWYSQPLSVLELPARVTNAMENRNIHTVGEMSQQEWDTLAQLRNFGPHSMEQIVAAFTERNLPHRLHKRGNKCQK